MKKDYKKRIEVECKDCGKKWIKRFDSIPQWEGRCFHCARIVVANRPEMKAVSSANGKKMMLKYNKHLPNARIFTSEMVSGEKSNHWKGGITPENLKIRQSKEYKDWRTAVFQRDDYTCQECKGKGYTLHADHIKPFAYFPELRLVIDNGRTLCADCHRKTFTYGKKVKNYFKINWNIT